MNNVELSEKVKEYLKGSESLAAKFEDLVAVSISLLSEDVEDMYVTVRDGEILVAPYTYDDNNCSIEATSETIDKLFAGELAFEKALNDGDVQVKSGDPAKFKALEVLVGKKAKSRSAKAKTQPEKSAEAHTKKSEAEAVKAEPEKPAETKTEEKPKTSAQNSSKRVKKNKKR